MITEKAVQEKETEWIPILKYVKILSEKGIPTTLDSVGNGLAICSIKGKFENDKWYIAKEELVKRIKASGKKLEPIEAGYYSIAGFIYYCSEYGVDIHEDNICHMIAHGHMEAKRDKYNRFVIPQHELDKRIEKFGAKK